MPTIREYSLGQCFLQALLIITLVFTAGCRDSDSSGSSPSSDTTQNDPDNTGGSEERNVASCDRTNPATAYYADGSTADSIDKPIPCFDYTDFGAAEPHIQLAPDGSIFQIPALIANGLPSIMEAGMAVSRDHAKTWEMIVPDNELFQPNDNALYIDPVTGRMFLALVSGEGAWVVGLTKIYTSTPASNYSEWNSVVLSGHVGAENPRFISGPTPEGEPEPANGERVTYVCANTNPAVSSPPILARVCHRTLDGGQTWDRGAILFTAGLPQHPECGSNPEKFEAVDGNYPRVAPNGSLWVTVQCGENTYLAHSTDGAMSFPIAKRSDGSPLTIPTLTAEQREAVDDPLPHVELRIDSQGNMYTLVKSGAELMLRISSDEGLTWTDPLNITAPEARDTEIRQWQMAIGRPGEVAVNYLSGRSDGGEDGYISITRNALDAKPIFFGAMINDSDSALTTKSGLGFDFIDIAIDDHGTPHGVFYGDCPADDSHPYCSAAGTPGGILPEGNTTTGPMAIIIGRLLWL